MKVGLISQGSDPESGRGIERYSYELRKGLEARGVDVGEITTGTSVRRGSFAMRTLFVLPLKAQFSGCDLTHATEPASAAFTNPDVVTVHDLMHWDSEGMEGRFARTCYRASMRAKKMIAVSEQTAAELVLRGAEPERVTVINEGVSEAFHPIEGLKDERLVGYVGDINPRKRIDLLLKAVAIAKESVKDVRLCIVGTHAASWNSVYEHRLVDLQHRLGLDLDVYYTGHVSESLLVRKYNEMSLLVLPSKEEGFGFPILEAARCGTSSAVMVDARISSEVKCTSLEASSVEDLAEHIVFMLSNPERAKALGELAMKEAQRFTWESCIEKTLDVYQELA